MLDNIIDCGNYGYAEDGDCYVIYEWRNGWQETGLSFECSEAQAREFCERYDGYSGAELLEEIGIK